jgi:serine/threonine-protein kinase
MSPDTPAKGTHRAVCIGKYEIVRHIASGGMGVVYKALDTESGREVALKVLAPEMAANPATLTRFRREARHADQLRHENVVRLYEFGEHRGTWFLALEFVEGIDLHEYVRRKGPLDPEEARRIIVQATLALHHTHQHGIVHRDIKPSNCLVTRKDGRMMIKLTDLGLSRRSCGDELSVTLAGSTVGTVDYIAPEQAKDSRAADTRSDIYSLGCTFFHLLAGQPPFAEGAVTERLFKHILEEPPDVRQFNPRVSEALTAVLGRMLAKRPEERYQSPAALLKDLLAAEGAAPAVSSTCAALTRTPAAVFDETVEREAVKTNPVLPRRRRRSGLLLGVAIALVVGVLIALVARRLATLHSARNPGVEGSPNPPARMSE